MAFKTIDASGNITDREGLTTLDLTFKSLRRYFVLANMFVPKDMPARDTHTEAVAALDHLGEKGYLLMDKWWRRYSTATPSLLRDGVLADFCDSQLGLFDDAVEHRRLRIDSRNWRCVDRHSGWP